MSVVHRAVEALPGRRGNELDFRRLLEALPAAAYTCDADGLITYFNRRAAEAWGREPKLRDPGDRYCGSFRMFTSDESPVPHDQCWMARCLHESKQYLGEEIVVERPDGQRLIVEAFATPFYDEEGKLAGAVNIILDVTDRKRTERQLRRSEEELTDFFDNATVGLHWVGPDGIILRANRAELDLLGYQPDEYLGHHVTEFYADKNVIEDILQRLHAGQKVDGYQARLRCKDGSIRHVLISSNVRWEDGQFVHTRCFTRDITERHQAEEAIRALTAQLTSDLTAMTRLQQVSTRLLQAGDFSMLLREILHAAIDITGADKGNLQMFEDEALKIVEQRGFEAPFLEFFNVVHEGVGACGTAIQVGKRVVIEDVETSSIFAGTPAMDVMLAAGVRAVQSTPLVSRSGRVLGMFSTHYRASHRPSEGELRTLDLLARQAADLMERMQAEQRLRQNEEALKDADRRKDEFLATLAHELRNPLAPIRNAVEVLRIKGSPDADLSAATDIIERQARQMTRLVDDLLDVSRITCGKIRLQRERVSLATVVTDAVSSTRPMMEELSHKLIVTLPPDAIFVDGDPVRLAQVFSNLLTNAAKFTERGGQIWVTAERQGNAAVIAVRDTGIGIAVEHIPHIFKMFSQALPAIERSQDGLGIGLSLVHALVELHGGRVEARSGGVGGGSEFVVHLPVVEVPEEAEVAPGATAHDHARTARQCRILIVDDNRDSTESLDMLLRLMGHETHTVHDGLEAVQATATFRPEVVLLDIGLPRMDGYEVARHIRQRPWGKKVLLVALTGWGQPEDRRRSRDTGFDYHLTKPVDPADLERLLARSMST